MLISNPQIIRFIAVFSLYDKQHLECGDYRLWLNRFFSFFFLKGLTLVGVVPAAGDERQPCRRSKARP